MTINIQSTVYFGNILLQGLVTTETTNIQNNVILFITYNIFKYKMKHKLLKENIASERLVTF